MPVQQERGDCVVLPVNKSVTYFPENLFALKCFPNREANSVAAVRLQVGGGCGFPSVQRPPPGQKKGAELKKKKKKLHGYSIES